MVKVTMPAKCKQCGCETIFKTFDVTGDKLDVHVDQN